MAGLLLQDEDVVRFQIAVDDARAVRGREALEHLSHESDGLFRRQAATRLDPLRESFSIEKLHDHVALAGWERAEIQDLENVIVADRARDLRFTLETLNNLRIRRDARVKEL